MSGDCLSSTMLWKARNLTRGPRGNGRSTTIHRLVSNQSMVVTMNWFESFVCHPAARIQQTLDDSKFIDAVAQLS